MAVTLDPIRKEHLPPDHLKLDDHREEEEVQEKVETTEKTKEPEKLPRELQEQFPTFLARKGFEFYDWLTGNSTKQITATVKELEASQQEEGEVTVAKALKNVLGQKFTQCGADKAHDSLEPFFGEKGKHGKLFKDYGIDFLQFMEAMCSADPNPKLKLEKGLFRDLVYSFLENFRAETKDVVESNAPFERKMLELHRLLQLKPQESESQEFTGFDAFKFCAAFLKDKDVKIFIEKSGVETIDNFGVWVTDLTDARWIEGKLLECFDDKTILEAILDYQDRFQGHSVVQLLEMLTPETLAKVEGKEAEKFSAKRTESGLGDPRAVCGPAMKDYVTAVLSDLQDRKE